MREKTENIFQNLKIVALYKIYIYMHIHGGNGLSFKHRLIIIIMTRRKQEKKD